ncbi:uncharacterized protein PpBr36_06732 [Pyricularia pennisetigena]|uniref:uncharacterized protein n=1 Tax=Pyricularia pennisetigena TaxID=1578925 RepID=UPI00114E4F37|nr:uncharacterized protein PpBr36_06732 [Pyricularia pennisetigena]TLS23348.1 hypothetical protein PpBr36_06732 [Pyricularia pennisetigena]
MDQSRGRSARQQAPGKKEWSMDADVQDWIYLRRRRDGSERGSKREQGSMSGQRLEYSPTQPSKDCFVLGGQRESGKSRVEATWSWATATSTTKQKASEKRKRAKKKTPKECRSSGGSRSRASYCSTTETGFEAE